MIVTTLVADRGSVATWQSSPSWADSTSWELVPSPGRRLKLLRTMLIVTLDFATAAAGVITHFRGSKDGYSGANGESYWFDRMYSSIWDYRKACDEYYEFSDHARFIWDYASPIELSYKENGKLVMDLSAPMPVDHAFLTCKCISETE